MFVIGRVCRGGCRISEMCVCVGGGGRGPGMWRFHAHVFPPPYEVLRSPKRAGEGPDPQDTPAPPWIRP